MTKHFSSPTDLIFLLFFSFLFLFNIFLIYLLFRKIFTGRIIGKKSHLGAETETSNYFLWPYQCYLQVSETVSWHKLQCFYFSNMMQRWVGGKGLIYLSKADPLEFQEMFPGIDLVSIIYMRYYHEIRGI